MASTFNAFELLKGNNPATSSKSKKNKKKKAASSAAAAEAQAAPQPSGASENHNANDGFLVSGKPAATKANGHAGGIAALTQSTAEYDVEIAALQAPPSPATRAATWAAWAAKGATGKKYLGPNQSQLTYPMMFLSTPCFESHLASIIDEPADAAAVQALHQAVQSIFTPAALADDGAVVLDTAISLSAAFFGSSMELRALAKDAVTEAAGTVRRAAAEKLLSNAALSDRMAAVNLQIDELRSLAEKAATAREQVSASGKLVEVFEQQLQCVQPVSISKEHSLASTEWFLSVLQTRNQDKLKPSKRAPSQLLISLEQEEQALAKQAAALDSQIQGVRQQLAALERDAAGLRQQLEQNQQRKVAIFQPAKDAGAAARERTALADLETLLNRSRVSNGAAKPHAGDASAAEPALLQYLEATEQHMAGLTRYQAELSRNLDFNLERFTVAAEQENRLRFLNMHAEAEKQTKNKAERLAKAKEGLALLQTLKSDAEKVMAGLRSRAGPTDPSNQLVVDCLGRLAPHFETLLTAVNSAQEQCTEKGIA